MNEYVKVTRIMLSTIVHSLMVHAQVLEAYISFALIYAADHIFPVLPIKDLLNKKNRTTIPFKLTTDMKPSI